MQISTLQTHVSALQTQVGTLIEEDIRRKNALKIRQFTCVFERRLLVLIFGWNSIWSWKSFNKTLCAFEERIMLADDSNKFREGMARFFFKYRPDDNKIKSVGNTIRLVIFALKKKGDKIAHPRGNIDLPKLLEISMPEHLKKNYNTILNVANRFEADDLFGHVGLLEMPKDPNILDLDEMDH